MTFEEIFELTWAPVIGFAFCMIYGLNLIITKNPSVLRAKGDTRIIQDEEKFAVKGGQLLLFLALGSAIMCGLVFISNAIAFAEIFAWFVVFSAMWRKMSKKYGPVGSLS